MKRKKTHLLALTLIFAVVLLTGFAYAALTGTLTFNGNVTLGADLELTIVPDAPFVSTAGGSTGAMTLINGQTAQIDVMLTAPGESVTLSFQVENTGGVDALIGTFVLSNTNSQFVITGDYRDLEGETVAVGATEPLTPVDITITWPSTGDATADAGNYTFTLAVDYEMA